jgi:hypothetical protein
MITQLDPPLPLHTPKGSGWAHFVLDYGTETDLVWVVFLNKDGSCWSIPNPEVRMTWNWTMGRRKPEDALASSKADTANGDPRVHIFPRAGET